jgi:hypothetical protein
MYLRKSYWPLPFILYLPAFIFIDHLTFKGILRKVVFSFFEDETIKMIYNFSAFKLIITSLLEELEDTKEVIRINNLQKKKKRSCIYAVTPWRAHRQVRNNWEIKKIKKNHYN